MKILRSCVLVLGLAPVVACYGSSNSFNKRAAKLACVHMEECQKSAFEEVYDSMSDCQADAKNALDVLYGSCDEYDSGQGRKCIHAMYGDRKKCSDNDEEEEDENNECEGVYDECSILDRADELDDAAAAVLDALPASLVEPVVGTRDRVR